jgi:type IV secretory pathway TrbF-like protein
MAIRNKFASGALAYVLGTVAVGVTTPVFAGDAGAFIGGVFATKLLGNMSAQTDAEQQQAAASSQMAAQQQAVPAHRSKSPQERIDELDKLAAGGYITPAEYKAKKQKILDSM